MKLHGPSWIRRWLLVLASMIPLAAAAEDESPELDPKAPHTHRSAARLGQLHLDQDLEGLGAHFRWPWLDEALDPWQQFKNRLLDEWGLDFFIGYSPQVQVGSQQRNRTFIGDRWELLGEWSLLESEQLGDGMISFWFHRTMTIGSNRGAQYQRGMGSAWELNDLDTGNDDERNEIGWLWWEQRLLDDRVRLAFGKLDPDALINTNRFLFDDRILFNFGTLASDPVVTLNESVGLGAFAELRFGPAYVSGIWVDADAKTRSIDFGSLDNGRYSFGAEIGLKTEIDGLGEGNYRASWFRTDSERRGASSKKSAMGWAISIDQDLGDNFASFLYWSSRSGRREPLRQNFSMGLVLRKPFGIQHDFVGLAFSWGEPDGGQGKDDQFGLEAFWRFQIIDRVELTPLLQYVISPADSGADTRLAGGLRLRIYL